MQSGYFNVTQMHYLYFWDEEARRYFMRLKDSPLFNEEDDYDDIYIEGLPDKGHWSC